MSDARDRAVVMITHSGRPEAVVVAQSLLAELAAGDLTVWMPTDEAAALGADTVQTYPPDGRPTSRVELVVVVGGDGTILRAAELALEVDAPVLGVNLGHVGFLAEVEPEDVAEVAAAVLDRNWVEEQRTVLDVVLYEGGQETWRTWALNEVSLEKVARERMVEVLLEVDERPLSRWGCDGVIVATPTGSTAYAWSAGGPVLWPDVLAMVVVPLSAHALFARSLVVSPSSVVSIDLASSRSGAVVWCDGRRSTDASVGSRVEVTTSSVPLRFARVHSRPFTDRLVRKFDLPVHGWRELRP